MAMVDSHYNHHFGAINGISRSGATFDAHVRNLIDDKYNREYKLHKETRSKAIEILSDFFAKHTDQANVSGLKFALLIWILRAAASQSVPNSFLTA